MGLTGIFRGLEIASSGMSVQRTRLNTIASNLANANTVLSADGDGFKPKEVIIESEPKNDFEEIFSQKIDLFNTNRQHFPTDKKEWEKVSIGNGAKVEAIVDKQIPPKLVYDPSHPLADENGYVHYPNINPIEEMVKMIEAQRAYEANVTSFNSVKAILQKSLEII